MDELTARQQRFASWHARVQSPRNSPRSSPRSSPRASKQALSKLPVRPFAERETMQARPTSALPPRAAQKAARPSTSQMASPRVNARPTALPPAPDDPEKLRPGQPGYRKPRGKSVKKPYLNRHVEKTNIKRWKAFTVAGSGGRVD